jgi:hypothetical protein
MILLANGQKERLEVDLFHHHLDEDGLEIPEAHRPVPLPAQHPAGQLRGVPLGPLGVARLDAILPPGLVLRDEVEWQKAPLAALGDQILCPVELPLGDEALVLQEVAPAARRGLKIDS